MFIEGQHLCDLYVIPRNLGFWVSSLSWIVCPMVRVGFHLYSAVLGVKRNASHFPMLRFSPYSVLHFTTLSTSPCMQLSASSFLLLLTASARSSAYALTRVSPLKRPSRSSIKMVNRSGDSTAPCARPLLVLW